MSRAFQTDTLRIKYFVGGTVSENDPIDNEDAVFEAAGCNDCRNRLPWSKEEAAVMT